MLQHRLQIPRRYSRRTRYLGWLMIVAVLTSVFIVHQAKRKRRPTVDRIEYFTAKPIAPATTFQHVHSPEMSRMVVASCHWRDGWHFACNYNQLKLVNTHTGEVKTVPPPVGVANWSPTAVWTEANRDTLIVTNMFGHDAYEFRYYADQLSVVRRFHVSDMLEPKGVAVSDDGSLVAIGDYEANRVWLFQRDGQLIWDRDVAWAHGVAFTPDGLAVSGLKKREIVLFDLAGQLLDRRGEFGWGDDCYMWPTGLCWAQDRLYVSDAHQGTVTMLSRTLEPLARVGGNGPGAGFFNMPYGVAVEDDEIIVCDTFKDRLVVLNRQWECQRTIDLNPAEQYETSATPITLERMLYTDVTSPITVSIPHLPTSTLFASYSGYTRRPARETFQIYYPQTGCVLNQRGFPYFCWALPVVHNDQTYLVMGHSQVTSVNATSEVLVVDQRGRCVFADVGDRLWIHAGETFTNQGKRFDWSSVMQLARADFAAYDRYLEANTAPIEAIRLVLQPQSQAWLPTTIWTDTTQQRLWVTNMLGRDAYEFRYDQQQLTIVRRYHALGMKEPKGIVVSPDGKLVAVADYEANRVWVFHQDGTLYWDRAVGLAHGVAFTPDGLVVSGLEKRELVLFDQAGNELRRQGQKGWGPNCYLWPTTVLWDGQHLMVSDAHQGTITTVDRSLNQIERWGGNGPGTGLFNMPYGLAYQQQELVVCDSFKDRLVVLNRRGQCQRIVSLNNDATWQISPLYESKRVDYADTATTIDLDIPGLPALSIHPNYGSFTRTVAPFTQQVYFPFAGSVHNKRGYPYFCWAIKVKYQDKPYILLGHSQVTHIDSTMFVLIVNEEGRGVLGETQSQLWAVNNALFTNNGQRVDYTPMLDQASLDFATFELAIRDGTSPIEATCNIIMPDSSLPSFLKLPIFVVKCENTFVSDAGKQFWLSWSNVRTLAERVKAAQSFDDSLATTKEHLYLQEVLLRNMLVPRR